MFQPADLSELRFHPYGDRRSLALRDNLISPEDTLAAADDLDAGTLAAIDRVAE